VRRDGVGSYSKAFQLKAEAHCSGAVTSPKG